MNHRVPRGTLCNTYYVNPTRSPCSSSACDDEHYQMGLGRKAPAETLKYLMDQSGMGVADVGRMIGSQPAASMVRHGRREPSKSQIRKLADHFKVEPGLFL